MKFVRVAVVVAALATLGPGVAVAEPPARPTNTPDADVKKVLRPGEVEIRGKVRKPAPPSITPPTISIRPPPERGESFLPKIVEAVDKEPFREAGR
jgi:hypothetical protein